MNRASECVSRKVEDDVYEHKAVDCSCDFGDTRCRSRNDTKRSDRSSRTEGLVKNSEGSADLYFGPKAPKDKEVNWIQTNAGESFLFI